MGEKPSPKIMKRMQILMASYQVFAQNGYRNTKIEDVARKANVAKGSVYQYFDSKEALFVELCLYVLKQMINEFEIVIRDGLEAFFMAMINIMDREQDFFKLMMEFWAYGDHEIMNLQFSEVYKDMRRILADAIRQDQDAGRIRKTLSPDSLASGLIALGDGFFVQALFSGEEPIKLWATQFFDIIQNGIRGPK